MRRHTARVDARQRASPCGARKPSRFRRRSRRPRRRRLRAPVESACAKSGARFWTHEGRRKRRVRGRRVAWFGPTAARARRRGFFFGVHRPRVLNRASPRRLARRFQRALHGPSRRLASESARRFRGRARLTKTSTRSSARCNHYSFLIAIATRTRGAGASAGRSRRHRVTAPHIMRTPIGRPHCALRAVVTSRRSIFPHERQSRDDDRRRLRRGHGDVPRRQRRAVRARRARGADAEAEEATGREEARARAQATVDARGRVIEGRRAGADRTIARFHLFADVVDVVVAGGTGRRRRRARADVADVGVGVSKPEREGEGGARGEGADEEGEG